MPTTITRKLAENNQSLASLDERICHAELRRDFPPPGCCRLDSVVQEELRVLYTGQAKLLQLIQRLKKDLIEFNFSETFKHTPHLMLRFVIRTVLNCTSTICGLQGFDLNSWIHS